MHLLDPSEYQANAAALVEQVGQALTRLIPGCRVEHVGSSAIPGAISKGDVDVCVVVPAHKHPDAIAALELAGYVVKQGTLRTPELCMLLSPHASSDLALQVVAEGSRFEFFMHFRDALRASPELVDQYNAIKRSCASSSPEQYRDAKAAFVERVLREA